MILSVVFTINVSLHFLSLISGLMPAPAKISEAMPETNDTAEGLSQRTHHHSGQPSDASHKKARKLRRAKPRFTQTQVSSVSSLSAHSIPSIERTLKLCFLRPLGIYSRCYPLYRELHRDAVPLPRMAVHEAHLHGAHCSLPTIVF